MSTKKERKFCSKCGSKTVITKLVQFEDKFYHSICLGTTFQKCPISGKILSKSKSDFYNDLRVIAPITFQLYIDSQISKKAD